MELLIKISTFISKSDSTIDLLGGIEKEYVMLIRMRTLNIDRLILGHLKKLIELPSNAL